MGFRAGVACGVHDRSSIWGSRWGDIHMRLEQGWHMEFRTGVYTHGVQNRDGMHGSEQGWHVEFRTPRLLLSDSSTCVQLFSGKLVLEGAESSSSLM